MELYKKNILHPRTTGTEFVIDKLEPRLTAIYNVTIGYPDIHPESEEVLLSAKTPETILIDVQRIPIASFPIKEERAAWIKNEWKRKELILNTLPFSPVSIQYNSNSTLLQTYIFWIIIIISIILLGKYYFIYFGIASCFIAVVTFLGGFDYYEQLVWKMKANAIKNSLLEPRQHKL